MKKNYLLIITLLINYCIGYGQDFGQFASGIKINTTLYNTTGDIGLTPFDGANLGTFGQNSSCANITAGEIKTFKNASANVCSASLFWRVYSTGFPSGSFNTVNLPFGDNCVSGNFEGQFGPCIDGDQKWKDYNLNVNFATGLSPGNYTLEIYYEYTGSNTSTSTCETTKYISNLGANYKANFTVTSPAVTCPANITQNVDTGLCTASVVTINPTIGDNCFITKLTWELTGATIASSAPTGINNIGTQVFNQGSTTITYTASDAANNTISCSYTITVTDNVIPTITAPANVNATTNTACTATGVALGTPTTADNCSVASTTNNAPAAFPLGNTTVTWTVTDGSGNTATANQTVTVTDNILPTITAPANVNATTNTACTATGVALGTPTTADNCSVASATNNAPVAFPLGNTTVTWIVTDGSGNTATANQTVTVTDNILPTITAPANVNATTNTACTATGVALGTPTTGDNCSVASTTNDAPAAFPLGNTTVTWIVTDGSGNTAIANQTVTVTDNILPTITAPANVNATTNTACTATGVALGTPTTADNCSVASATNNAPAAFPLGNTTVTWTVTDGSGNTASANQTVTVTDNINPTISCPTNMTANVGAGTCTASVNTTNPTIADNCSVTKLTWTLTGATVASSASTGINNLATQIFNLGTTTVTYTVSDAANNTATCSYTVTISDNINPTISCPTNMTANVGAGTCIASINTPNPTTADNCSVTKLTWTLTGATVANSAATGINNLGTQVFNLGTTTVTYAVSDAANNTATCSYTVTVSDNINPTISCPTNMTANVGAGTCTASVNTTNPTTADNCSVTKLTWTLTGATTASSAATGINNLGTQIFNLGTTTVTYTVSDAANNTATCSYTVTVSDNINPTISCPTNMTANVGAGTCTASVNTPNPTTADNCSVTKLTWTLTGATTASSAATGINNLGTQIFNLGTTAVTYTVSDAANNTATCSYTVTVSDNINPTITCPANLAPNVGAGTCTASVNTPNPTTADNCSVTKLTWTLTGATTASSLATGINNLGTQIFNLGTTTVTYTVSDAANNTATCSYTVTVSDNINPTISCPTNMTANVGAGTCTASVNTPNPTTADNCSVTKLTWTLTGATIASSAATGINNLGTRIFNLGTTTVTYIVSDAANNTATCSYTVTVSDNINPTITCPANLTPNVGAGTCTASVNTTNPTTADNCSVTKLTWTLSGATTASSAATGINNLGTRVFNLGLTTVTYRVEDAAGNFTTCSYTVTVTDNINPTITAPTATTGTTNVNCTSTNVVLGTPTTADNCSVASVTNNAPAAFPLGNTTVIWTVTDGSGRTATANQTVTVTDNINPTISCPANMNANTSASCTASVITPNPTTADNCAITKLTWALSGATVASSAATGINNLGTRIFNLGTTTVTYIASDAANNTATCFYTVTVSDNINPTITCPANLTPNVGAGTCTASVNTTNPTTADNCAVTKLTWTLSGATVASSAATGINNLGTRVFNLGLTTVTYRVEDAAGNFTTCSYTVTVTDNINPTITAPTATTGTTNVNCTSTNVVLGTPTTADNCSVASVTNNAPAAFPLGNTTVIWTVTDGSGRTATANQTVTVTDNINPTISCPANMNANTSASCTASVVTPNPTTTDNCVVIKLTWTLTGATIASSAATGINNLGTRIFNLGTTTVTYIASDAANNTATCSYMVTVSDNINPTITCPANLTPNVGAGTCTASINTTNPTTADNCSVTKLTWALTGATVANSAATGINNLGTRVFNLGTTTVTYIASDAANNTATCSYTVTVSDNINPTISCPTNMTANVGAGTCTASVITPNPTIADNCSVTKLTWALTGATIASSTATGINNLGTRIFNLGLTTVAYRVEDAAGNFITCSYTVTITDNINPTINAPANITATTNIACTATGIVLGTPITSDNCSVASVTNNHASTTYPLGTTTVTWTVTDGSGRIATATQTVTVTDNVNPTLTQGSNQSATTAIGSCTASVAIIDAGFADNCSGSSIAYTLSGATVKALTAGQVGTYAFNKGVTTITYTVTDGATPANTFTGTKTVTVTDNVKPVAPALPTIAAQCNVTVPFPVATDNCDGSVTATTSDNRTFTTQGNFAIIWSFKDSSNNETIATQNVVIDDTIDPVPSIASLSPLNITNCQIDSLTPPTANDNCQGTITGTTTTPLPITTLGTTVVTWTYNDGNGNTSTQTQNINLTAPSISGGSLLGYVSGLIPAAVPSENIAISSCPDDVNPITINLSSEIGTIVHWEKFEAGDTAWSIISNTTNSYNIVFNYSNTKSTLFRVLVQVGNCTKYSNMVNVHAIPPDVPPILDQSDFNICLNDSVSLVARSGYTSTINVGEGGDFDIGQFPDKWDPTQWRIDDQVAGAQWTAAGNNTKFNNWSGTNNHPVGTLYRIEYDSNDLKFGIAHGNYNSAAYIAEFGVGPTTLETPLFSLVGLKTAAVEFDQAYNLHTGDIAKLELLIFAADGTTLTNTIVLQDLIGTSPHALSWGDTHGIPVPYPYQAPKPNNSTTTYFDFNTDNSSFDISDYIGNDNVRVKWTFFGTTDESAWAIDNIAIPVRPYFDDVEWTDGLGEPGEYIIRNKLEATYTFVPSAPGVHLYGATSLINGCRAYDADGTAIATVKVNYAYAGQAQGYTNAECGERTVNLNAYDNTKSANQNNDDGAYPTLVRNDFSDDPGTGATGTWSVVTASNACGTYSFSDITSPTSTFSGDEGVYTLRWKLDVSGCYSDVQVTLTSCKVIDFDGVNDYISFKDNYGLGSAFSIETWVKPDPQPANPPSNIQTIISKRNANNLVDGYDLRLVGSTLSFNWNNGSQITSPFSLSTSRWYHVAVTYAGGIYRLYVDGIEVINAAGSAPISNSFTCLAGAMDQTGNPPNKPVNHFSGWMDELRIWGVGLSPHHVRQMMNQQIINNGTAVRGEIIPIDINGPDANSDGVDDQPLYWSNLDGYYRMDFISCGYLKPFGGKGVDGQLRNITSSQEETAPLPYVSIRDGNWMDRGAGTTPWKYGDSVWDYPNSTGYNGTPIDWNIVQTAHNISSENKDITVLGLISTAGKLTIADPTITTPIEKNDGQGLWITHYLKLNGNIDLVGESQLLEKRHGIYNSSDIFITTQFSESILDATSTGFIKRDQQGKRNSFNYNYWSSPVSTIQGSVNNMPYTINNVIKDGTNSATPKTITFGSTFDFADTPISDPIKTTDRWIWSYNSPIVAGDEWANYYQWYHVTSSGALKVGEAYTMKGTGGTAPLTDLQNYSFIGKPNSGTITLSLTKDNSYLVGNPYPSALDADEFIKDNLKDCLGCRASVNSFSGALYFWDHFGISNNHYLAEYEGGYATYTLMGGVAAINNSPLNLNDGANGANIPKRYIPIAQGFFIDGYIDFEVTGSQIPTTVEGGSILFKDNQRVFQRESVASSVFMKKRENTKTNTNARQKIRLGFDSSIGAHRQLLVGVDSNTTNLFDIGYDAPMFDTNENDMFWEISDSQFVIQGVPDFNTDRIIPLGIVVANEGEVTIKIDELENVSAGTKIYLYDNVTGTYHDLKTSDFKTMLTIGEYNKRFSLKFENQLLDVVENDSNDGIMVLYSRNYKTLIIKNNDLDATVNTVSLFNMLGQAISNWDVEDKEQTNIQIPIKNMPSGIYIVKIKTSKGESSKKIIVN